MTVDGRSLRMSTTSVLFSDRTLPLESHTGTAELYPGRKRTSVIFVGFCSAKSGTVEPNKQNGVVMAPIYLTQIARNNQKKVVNHLR